MSFFQEGCTTALNQVLLPLPTPAELNQQNQHAPHAQNHPVAATVDRVELAVMTESLGDGEGAWVAAGRRRKVASSRSKLSNFSPKEDVFLANSWLEISCDTIINTGQRKEGFWARIANQYNNKRGSFHERSFRSL
jgi:hypothetical protein